MSTEPTFACYNFSIPCILIFHQPNDGFRIKPNYSSRYIVLFHFPGFNFNQDYEFVSRNRDHFQESNFTHSNLCTLEMNIYMKEKNSKQLRYCTNFLTCSMAYRNLFSKSFTRFCSSAGERLRLLPKYVLLDVLLLSFGISAGVVGSDWLIFPFPPGLEGKPFRCDVCVGVLCLPVSKIWLKKTRYRVSITFVCSQ